MKIVVCIKQVPDSWAEKNLVADNTLDRESVDAVMNELDEYAVEEALTLAQALGGEVTILSMGPAQAEKTIRKALSMGAHAGVHVLDDGLHGSDAVGTARALAAAILAQQADLVMFGIESTDARMSVVPAMVAELTGLPQMTSAAKITVDGSTVTIERHTETGTDQVMCELPALIGVVEKINEPRYPSFKGIMAAKKKKIETLNLSALGIPAAQVGLAGAWTVVEEASARPAKAKGVIVTDGGTGGAAIAEFLSTQKLI